MNHEVNATPDGNAKLPQRGHDSSNVSIKEEHVVFTYNAPNSSAHSNRPEFLVVLGIFVEGHKPVGREIGDQVRRQLIVHQELNNISKKVEVGSILRGVMVGLIKGKILENHRKITIRVSC